MISADNYYSIANFNFTYFKSYYREISISENTFGISVTCIKQVCKDCHNKRCRARRKAVEL